MGAPGSERHGALALLPPLSVAVVAVALPAARAQACTRDKAGALPCCRACRGHGTQAVGDRLVATACGVVERVNKLVTVRSLRSRYGAEVGGVVVGRIVEVRAVGAGAAQRLRRDCAAVACAHNPDTAGHGWWTRKTPPPCHGVRR